MRIEFGQLTILNFKSVKELKLDLGKYEPGLHFLRGQNLIEPRLGSNGAGKSTLFDALVWCLFGTTPNGLRNPDVRPWRAGAGQTRVQLQLFVGDVEWLIERAISPNEIKLNGALSTQEAVEALLGLNLDLTLATIVLGQGQPLFLDLTPRDKLQVLNDAQGLERWEERSKRAAAKVAELIKKQQGFDQDRKSVV